MDYLKSLSVFVRVAELGSFTAAAEEAGVSSTMVGKHIQALEARLGGPLLARTTRRQSLTDLGREFLARGRTILAEVAAADGAAEALRHAPRGQLRVSAPTALAVDALVAVIAAFRTACPEVEVELMVADRVVDLVEEGVHVAIRTGAVADDDLIARPLAPYDVVACASPSYLDARPPIVHPRDLDGHERLTLAAWGRRPTWRFIRGEESCVVPAAGALRTDNVVALRQAALAGLGVTVLARALAAQALAEGRLRPVAPEWRLRARPTFVVWPRHLRGSPKVRAFVTAVEAGLGGAAT